MIHLTWHIVGTDVCKAVKEFFAKGKLLGELNATLITLVPKISTPKKVSDFRPIACCNVLYKSISKIITNRIKNALDSIIHKNQSAFIPNRQITDNILLSQELLKGYDCKKGPKRCSMKIDIQKAYDTVDWGFLEDTLRLGERTEARLKITHLSFADDLLVLCNGDANSVKVIKKALDSFSKVSGLHPNLGKLPMRYLGVPLVAKKIGVKDCKCLLDKIKDRISCWKNNSLSYAVRTQLLASVLASIQVYWASVFRFPKMVIKDMEQLFKGFLWNKVEILLVKHLWNVAAKKDTLWVQWIYMEKLKERSVWEVDKQIKDSWSCKCLLDLRDEVRNHMQYIVRNGCNISTWHDKWCHLPALDSIVSRREIFAAGFSNEDTIAGCILDNKWKWPEEWYSKYPILNQYIVPTLNNDISDKLMWIGNNGCEKEHAFVLWMAIKGKLVTQDKLNVWYPGKNLKCPLCLKIEDSHKHLFFECDYSKSVWREMQSLANIQQLNDLESSMNSLASLPCKNNIWSVVRRICVADTVYHLWQERNLRTFQDKNRSYKCLITVIKDNIKSRLIVGKNMVLRPAEFVTSQRNRSDTEIKGVFGYSRWPCILNLSLSKLMFWNSINWSGLGRRL
ncbi:RNA-directed DNA polymerase, eukaryota, reverse transcriptase zinc-binding domain protein, partial [Tanacetum coccineum]